MSRLKEICIDCSDPGLLLHGWAEVFGYQLRSHSVDDLAALREHGNHEPEDDPSIAVDPVDEPGLTFWFNRVLKRESAKNRVHVDVCGDVDLLVGFGATLVE